MEYLVSFLDIFLFHLPVCSPGFSTCSGALSVQLTSVDSMEGSRPSAFHVGLPSGRHQEQVRWERRVRLAYLFSGVLAPPHTPPPYLISPILDYSVLVHPMKITVAGWSLAHKNSHLHPSGLGGHSGSKDVSLENHIRSLASLYPAHTFVISPFIKFSSNDSASVWLFVVICFFLFFVFLPWTLTITKLKPKNKLKTKAINYSGNFI